MNYHEALEYIHGTLKFGMKFGLENIKTLLGLMGNPHKQLKYVHVAGTNGKGSTVAFISSILIESGYKVGIYTSPYLERFTERIKINNEEISEDDVAGLTGFVKSKVAMMTSSGGNHPTEFEIVTAIGFQYFYNKGCDIVVLEAGLGGRLDSTNVIETPAVSVITTINYDHMDKLGDTITQIAFEKAGIIKENCDVILYPQSNELEKVFADICNEKKSPLHIVDFSQLDIKKSGFDRQVFDYGEYKELLIRLPGMHQFRNAVVALNTCELLRKKGYHITDDSIRKGLENTGWPGRLEKLRENPVFIIDAAHNEEGAAALAEALKTYLPDKRIFFIMGVLKDKDYESIIRTVSHMAHHIIAVAPNSERALSAQQLAIYVNRYCTNVSISDTIDNAITSCIGMCNYDDVICAFGSHYLIGEIKKYFSAVSGN